MVRLNWCYENNSRENRERGERENSIIDIFKCYIHGISNGLFIAKGWEILTESG